MPRKPYPRQISHRVGQSHIAFRGPAGGEQDALPPEFALSHGTQSPFPVAVAHVDMEAVVSTSPSDSFPSLDVERIIDED
ncbi:hypothetical protein FQU75_22740 [Paenibacillus polymyxa]|uniref:Uncharacterized protein n=1 Tax=Paenibacillus ottowii TaxID=2315729 RepID=A0ABY3BD88_9BACL|nr:hypothetical protein [Paenibacillus ottowii]NEU27165.1 hypothetical protein [Paenibacillus polymyxa]QDY85926.1 hypothetical protein FQU75_22740 [Paenibacillus polymyxa]TQS01123.1 hypothetical protein FKV70_01885 [Paenibacillus ottowii]